MKILKTYEAFVDEEGELKDFEFDKEIYPIDLIASNLEEFVSNNNDTMENEGWDILSVDESNVDHNYQIKDGEWFVPNNMKAKIYQVSPSDMSFVSNIKHDKHKHLSDEYQKAFEKAESAGVIIDDSGIVRGFHGNDLIDAYNIKQLKMKYESKSDFGIDSEWEEVQLGLDVYQLYELLLYTYGKEFLPDTEEAIEEYEGDYNPDHIYEIIRYELESKDKFEDFIKNWEQYEIKMQENDPLHWRYRQKNYGNHGKEW